MVDFLSGKVRKTPPNQVPENRYKFLRLQDAEPDLGVASGNNYILTSDTEGSRVWKNPMDAAVAKRMPNSGVIAFIVPP